jgi:hypothetical protein
MRDGVPLLGLNIRLDSSRRPLIASILTDLAVTSNDY